MSNIFPCLCCGAEANEWCKPNCRPPEYEEPAPPPENPPNTGNRDSEEERLKAWCFWVSKNPLDDDQAAMGKAITALFTSRAELMAGVKRGEEERKDLKAYIRGALNNLDDAHAVNLEGSLLRSRSAIEVAQLCLREALGDGEGKE